jgi:hypothetical protein
VGKVTLLQFDPQPADQRPVLGTRLHEYRRHLIKIHRRPFIAVAELPQLEQLLWPNETRIALMPYLAASYCHSGAAGGNEERLLICRSRPARGGWSGFCNPNHQQGTAFETHNGRSTLVTGTALHGPIPEAANWQVATLIL